MKLGVFTTLLSNLSFEEALKHCPADKCRAHRHSPRVGKVAAHRQPLAGLPRRDSILCARDGATPQPVQLFGTHARPLDRGDACT